MKLETDGIQYEILERAIAQVQSVPGIFLEIGTRKGGSMQIIIDAAIATQQANRHFVSVDPYGHILYNDGKSLTRYDYTNDMKTAALANLYAYANKVGVNLITFTLDDVEFMRRFKDGIPVYDIEKRYETSIAFAFLDGPHDIKSILKELQYVEFRSHPGAAVVVDNIDLFDVTELLRALEGTDWKEQERNAQKIWLTRV